VGHDGGSTCRGDHATSMLHQALEPTMQRSAGDTWPPLLAVHRGHGTLACRCREQDVARQGSVRLGVSRRDARAPGAKSWGGGDLIGDVRHQNASGRRGAGSRGPGEARRRGFGGFLTSWRRRAARGRAIGGGGCESQGLAKNRRR